MKKLKKERLQNLKKTLDKHNIKHFNDFEVLVYNSPWKVVNRKNEIRVTIKYNNMNEKNKKLYKAYFGGGCFWCVEAIFEDVIGVKNVDSGYSGGKNKKPII